MAFISKKRVTICLSPFISVQFVYKVNAEDDNESSTENQEEEDEEEDAEESNNSPTSSQSDG